MKITDTAVETIDNNLKKCTEIIVLMYRASDQPMNISEPIQSWHDEILKLECLVDDMQGIFQTDLTD